MPIWMQILGQVIIDCILGAFAIYVGYNAVKFFKHPVQNYRKFQQEIEELGDFEEPPTF